MHIQQFIKKKTNHALISRFIELNWDENKKESLLLLYYLIFRPRCHKWGKKTQSVEKSTIKPSLVLCLRAEKLEIELLYPTTSIMKTIDAGDYTICGFVDHIKYDIRIISFRDD